MTPAGTDGDASVRILDVECDEAVVVAAVGEDDDAGRSTDPFSGDDFRGLGPYVHESATISPCQADKPICLLPHYV